MEGSEEEVQRVVEWCKKGPSRAKVERVEVEEGKIVQEKYTAEFKGFEIL